MTDNMKSQLYVSPQTNWTELSSESLVCASNGLVESTSETENFTQWEYEW